jgi:hypothetical protein
MKPNLSIDELMDEAGIPTSEEVLLAELAKAHSKIYALTGALRNTRGELKEVRRNMQKILKEKKKTEKPQLRKGQKRGHHGFNG